MGDLFKGRQCVFHVNSIRIKYPSVKGFNKIIHAFIYPVLLDIYLFNAYNITSSRETGQGENQPMESTKYDLKTAKRIAYFGAIKMDDQGYEIRSVWAYDMIGGQLRGGAHTVRKGLTVYTVRDSITTPTRTLTCTCPFYEANGACKHQLKVSWLVADAEETALRDAQEDAWADEALARMEALEGLEGDALTRSYARS